MTKKITVPKFKSEKEEADWWYANRKQVSELFRKATQSGQKGKVLTPAMVKEQMRQSAAKRAVAKKTTDSTNS